MALKSMLPLLGPNGTSWPWPMQRIPSGRACWPVGIYRFDYEEGQRCFSSSSHKGGLVRHLDNEISKWHVKMTRVCELTQAFDSKCFCVFLHICKYLLSPSSFLFFFFFTRLKFQQKPADTRFIRGGLWWENGAKELIVWKKVGNVGHADKFGCLAFVVWIKIKVSFSAVTLH